jgi:hypothetical protein
MHKRNPKSVSRADDNFIKKKPTEDNASEEVNAFKLPADGFSRTHKRNLNRLS